MASTRLHGPKPQVFGKAVVSAPVELWQDPTPGTAELSSGQCTVAQYDTKGAMMKTPLPVTGWRTSDPNGKVDGAGKLSCVGSTIPDGGKVPTETQAEVNGVWWS